MLSQLVEFRVLQEGSPGRLSHPPACFPPSSRKDRAEKIRQMEELEAQARRSAEEPGRGGSLPISMELMFLGFSHTGWQESGVVTPVLYPIAKRFPRLSRQAGEWTNKAQKCYPDLPSGSGPKPCHEAPRCKFCCGA